MSLAIAYGMKKKKMAKGGDVKHKHVKGVHKPVSGEGSERYPGMSEAGEDYVDSRLGYGEESPAGGHKDTYRKKAKAKHYQVLGEMHEQSKKDRKNLAKGGDVHAEDCPGCETCYAKGGDVKGTHGQDPSGNKGVSKAGHFVRRAREQRESNKGRVSEGIAQNWEHSAKSHHENVLGEMKEMSKHDRKNLAEGGDVQHDDNDDLVLSIMKKRYSKGGQVSNDVGEGEDVDAMPNQFDDLVLDDDLDSSYTGENSGDEVGDEQEDEDQRDIVSQVMKSRKKKDRMPRPA